jgi:hypothetical protein
MDEWQITTSTTQRTGLREHVLNVMDKPRTAGDNDRVRPINRLEIDPVTPRRGTVKRLSQALPYAGGHVRVDLVELGVVG